MFLLLFAQCLCLLLQNIQPFQLDIKKYKEKNLLLSFKQNFLINILFYGIKYIFIKPI